MKSEKLHFTINAEDAIKRLKKAIDRLGATDLEHGYSKQGDNYSVNISFKIKGVPYKFTYSTTIAKYYNQLPGKDSDILNALIYGLSQLALLSSRGIFDFTKLIAGYKELPFIQLPSWASFMGFQLMPRSYSEVEARFKELVKGSMNNEQHPGDFIKLQDAMKVARQFFGVGESA